MKTLYRYAMVFLASLTLLMIGISTTPMMFDESHYVGAARAFIAGTPSTNPEHPPLAKYFIALSIKTFGDHALGWRFPSALAGALAALSVFGLTWTMTRSLHTSYVAWLLTIANGFWFVMSRVAMLSIFELAFETAGVWALLFAVQEKKTRWFGFSGALFGLSIASRWCGVIGLAVCVVYALVYYRSFFKSAAVSMTIGTAILVYAVTWIPLIVREHRTTRYLLTANEYIFQFHRHVEGDPRLVEAWWTWIFRLRPQPSLSYLVGNPVVAILGIAAIVALLWHKKPLLPALYLAHIVQWAIAIRPLTYYYYYLEAFTWLTVALAVALQGVAMRRVRFDVVVTGCALAVFVQWYVHWYAA